MKLCIIGSGIGMVLLVCITLIRNELNVIINEELFMITFTGFLFLFLFSIILWLNDTFTSDRL